MAIADNPADVHKFTIKRNSVAVVTDGTAVLGLGDIGPAAALPVMEGKAMLFKEFAGVDAFPICLDVSSADELIETVERLAPVFGGINLEDIAAPRCFEVEDRLKASLDIPVFHDDQHGTAVVVLAALRNALKVVDKKMEDLKVVMAGAGAAGVAITKILQEAGVPNIIAVDRKGALYVGRDSLDVSKQWMAEHTNPEQRKGTLHEVMPGADVFVGVSGPGPADPRRPAGHAHRPDRVRPGQPRPRDHAGGRRRPRRRRSPPAGATIPNQINNVLCFPGIFRGALDAGATTITEGMKLAAAEAIASAVPEDELSATLRGAQRVQQARRRARRRARSPMPPVTRASCARPRARRLMAIEAVTFDHWNTLVYEERGQLRGRRLEAWAGILEDAGFAARAPAAREGVRLGVGGLRRSRGRSGEQYLAAQAAEHIIEELGLRRARPTCASALVDAFTNAGRGRGLPSRPTASRSASTTLKDAGVRLGIICDVGFTPSDVLREHLIRRGLLPLFDHWSFSDEVGFYKPAPGDLRARARGPRRRRARRGPPTWATSAAPTSPARIAMGMVSVRYTGVFDDDSVPEPEADHVVADMRKLPQALGF